MSSHYNDRIEYFQKDYMTSKASNIYFLDIHKKTFADSFPRAASFGRKT